MKRLLVCTGCILIVVTLCFVYFGVPAPVPTHIERRVVLDGGGCVLSMECFRSSEKSERLHVELQNHSESRIYHLRFTRDGKVILSADAHPGAPLERSIPFSVPLTVSVFSEGFSAHYRIEPADHG